LPQTFEAMVTYLSYRINRTALEYFLGDKAHKVNEKYEKYLELISLDGLNTGLAQKN
jgi:hypothetical protein